MFYLANIHNGDPGSIYNLGRSRSGAEDHSEPPRPPPPRPEGNLNFSIIIAHSHNFNFKITCMNISLCLFYRLLQYN